MINLKSDIIIIVILLVVFISTPTQVFAQTSTVDKYIDIYEIPTARFGIHEAKNPDGTYYPGDPISFGYQVLGIPPVAGGESIRVEASIDTEYYVVSRGEGFIVINSTSAMTYKVYQTTVSVRMIHEKTGVEITKESKTFYHQLVPYRPEIYAFPYTVLNDNQRYSYQDRTGMVINFAGSRGNDLSDQTIYPERRLFLYENFTSVVTGQEFTFMNIGGYDVPTGIRESVTYDVLDISRNNPDRLIYMDRAGHEKFYYTTTPRNQTAINGANSMNMTVIYYWHDGAEFWQDVEYAMPNPRHSIANTFKVLVIPSTPANVTLSVQDGYQSMQDYVYQQALEHTRDPVTAELVREDIPPPVVSLGDDYGEIEFRVGKMSQYQLPILYNATDFGSVMDTSFTPVKVDIVTEYGSWSKEYSSYSFDQDYEINVDTRQDAPLEIWRGVGSNSYKIKAEWDITRVETGNSSIVHACIAQECTLELINPNNVNATVTAFNEFGGSSTATVPPLQPHYNPLNKQVLDDFWLTITIVLSLGAFLLVVIKLINHLNK
jgi:hypothetical protein